MDVAEVQSIAREFAPAVSNYVAQALGPVIFRIEAIERRLDALPGARDGRDGRDADPADIERLVERAVARLALPSGPPGEPGRDGKDADPETIASIIGRSVEAIASRLPPGAPGEPGCDGKDGADGVAGKDGTSVTGERGPPGRDGVDGADGASVTLDDVAPLIDDAVAKAMAAVPAGRDGAPGQDASPEMIAPMIRAETEAIRRALQNEVARLPEFVAMEVAEAVAKAAVPRETDALNLSMMVKGAVENAVAAIPPPERGPQGEPGRDGADGAAGEPGAQGEPGRDGESIKGDPGEPGPAGEPGREGRDADMAALELRIDETLKQAIAGLPEPARGEKGEPGAAGRDGVDADQEALQTLLREAVTEAVAALPPAEPGRDGKDGVDGIDGQVGVTGERGIAGDRGPQGERGEMGATGVGVAGAVIDREGVLVLTLSDGTTKALSKVVGADGVSIDPAAVAAMVEREVGKIPAPKDGRDGIDGTDGKDGANGRDGVDGFGFDDLEFVQDGDRRAFLRFVQGDRIKEFIVGLPGQIYRGVWKPDVEYVRGDTVTWGGSLFVVQTDNPEGKPEASKDFRLAVKRGRDGKDGKDGRPGEKGIPGAEGRPGRDGISYPQA